MTTVAVLDANVLIPNALCDFLLRLAEEDLYQPRWSPTILDGYDATYRFRPPRSSAGSRS